jgi:tetratricopeptide (TPR) repeat protein
MRRTATRFGLAVLSGLMVLASVSATPRPQQQQPPQQPQYTKEEADAYNAIFQAQKAGKIDEAIKAAEDFLGKFPKSILAPNAKQILVVFCAQSNNLDKAFAAGGELLGTDGNNFTVLYVLSLAAAEASKAGNKKYDADALKYATKVLDIIGSGQPPAGVPASAWDSQKGKISGQMHQAAGLFLYNGADFDGAIQHLKAASESDPKDPVTVYLIGESFKLGKYAKLQGDYNKLTDDEKIADAGKAILKQVDEVVDQMIDTYAKVVALAESDANFQKLGEEARKTLEGFYKYRHNNTTDGMDELIKKYKPGTQATS